MVIREYVYTLMHVDMYSLCPWKNYEKLQGIPTINPSIIVRSFVYCE